ncbi:MAG TPA: tetratricopeptide repeat protein, partial [Vicinamibacterales bacterium]|nr:tetratricopeptide repeat protein [Vicinamibacterales bacterium]
MLPRLVIIVIAFASGIVMLSAQAPTDFAEQLRRANAQFKDGKYADALKSYVRSAESPDSVAAGDARKGIVLSALRVGEFTLARRTASTLSSNDHDAEALTLSGDALWAAGYFDEADREYARALEVDPDSARARYGIARSLSSRSRLSEALTEVEGALELAPQDSDLAALQGTVLERLNRFEEAAKAYDSYANLLPRRESAAISIARSRAGLLRSFSKRTPLDVS